MPETEMKFWADYRKVVSFREDRFNPVLLACSERMKAALLCVASSQSIPTHSPKIDLVFLVLQGEGWIDSEGDALKVGPGSVVYIPAGKPRGVRALSNLVALHVVSPPPSSADHEEVMRALRGKGESP